MVSEWRVIKIHQWTVASLMASLIIWPYLRHLYWLSCVAILIWNTFLLYEYQAIITYVHSSAIVRDQPC